jgi:hypothetical protein
MSDARASDVPDRGASAFVVGAWIGYLALSHVQLRVDY